MLSRIRPATEEEIKVIMETKDGRGGSVLALDSPQGPLFAVIRTAVEVDPVLYPEDLPFKMKLLFQRDIETVLATQGVQQYFCNVHVSNEKMLSVLKTFGAIQASTEPEYRFMKVL